MKTQQLFDSLLNWFRPGHKTHVYYVEKRMKFGKYHVLHRENCEVLPDVNGRLEVGRGSDMELILTQAKKHYQHVELCPQCCKIEKPESNV
ncbi:hypothetical protein [uncultured Christiangramia sp.]|uniref:hypothetical protein n=1 Tax=uncultured Christiangramia sp. TaxID=503836 RepID=UPI00263561A9|nr:hypothetical protein [uncultured Christiangramia sp.]